MRVALVLAVSGCTGIVLEPVIDVPFNDPDAEAFQSIGELEITLASDGRDLITKRFARGATLELPEVSFGSKFVIHMTGSLGTTQVGYGRTCEFDVTQDEVPTSPHLFYSASRKFATTDLITAPRTGGQAFAYEGGAVLVGGGTQVIERFDPLTGELTESSEVLAPRTGAIGALLGLSTPRIVVIGGLQAAVVELFDPREGVETIPNASMGREGMTATSLTDGRVIVVGGHSEGVVSGSIVQIEPDGTGAEISNVAVLASARWGHTATRLGDDLGAPVLIAGGVDATGATVTNAELFRPLSGTLSPMFSPAMQHPRTGHRAARMADGSVLFIGGVDAAGNPVRDLERFTIDEGFVELVNARGEPVPLDAIVGVVDMSVTTLPDDRLLVAGGRPDGSGAPTNVAYVLRLDPGTGTLDIGPTDRLATPRANHQAAILCDGTVFISGGSEELAAERYNPPPAGRR